MATTSAILYLQEVSLRMKRQLRTGDVLGRLGGDEFAALVSVVRGRADVEEIATAPGTLLRRALCHGRLRPARLGKRGHGDLSRPMAQTSDSLLSAADAAMYEAKNTRRCNRKNRSAQERLKFSGKSRRSSHIPPAASRPDSRHSLHRHRAKRRGPACAGPLQMNNGNAVFASQLLSANS